MGLRSLAESVESLTKPAFFKRGLADGAVARDWSNIVGPHLAAHTLPEKISHAVAGSGGGTLHLRVDHGGFAAELQHLVPLLIERINGYFGYAAVERVRIVQGPLPLRDAPPPPPEVLPLSADEEAALECTLASVENPDLKAALAALGRVLAKRS